MPKKQTRKTKNTKKLRIPKWLIAVLAIALVALATFGVLSMMRYASPDEDAATDTQTTNDATKIEDAPVDASEVEGSDRKDEAEAEDEKRQAAEKTESGKTAAAPVVNYAGVEGENVVAGGTISNIVETEGTCNYIFTKGAQSFTRATAVLPNAKNTVCEAVSVSKENFSAGVWQVVLQYQSNSAEGQSEATTFEVK